MSTRDLAKQAARQGVPSTPKRRAIGSEQAALLISYHYARTYGSFIRLESPRTMRIRIDDLKETLAHVERGSCCSVTIARTIRDFERISELLEMIPTV